MMYFVAVRNYINMKILSSIILIASLAIPLHGCGGSDSDSSEDVVYNETVKIEEGMYVSLSLDPATYRTEITSSNNGVVVSWVGGNSCVASKETKTYAMSCQLNIKGQILITNPTLLGLGGTEIVTVKVIKI